MSEFTEALVLAGFGFGFVFFFLSFLILLLTLSSYLFARFSDSEDELREAAAIAALRHHSKRSN